MLKPRSEVLSLQKAAVVGMAASRPHGWLERVMSLVRDGGDGWLYVTDENALAVRDLVVGVAAGGCQGCGG
jgi:hypothetical protein